MDTVLIVEDEKLIRQGIKSMLLRCGVPVSTIIECSNGAMALDVLREEQVDVMFTDIRMPKMDGITLVKEMQELEERPLIVVISGYDDFSYAVEMLRMGVKEYILKPIDREQIASVMRKLEEEWSRRKEEKEANRHISYQQLRLLCMQEQMPKEEQELIIRRYADSFFQEPYVVCCCNYEGEDYEQGNSYICLRNVGEHQVFVVACQNQGFLMKNELRNCCVGMSSPMQGLKALPQAYRQARSMREQAFAKGASLLQYDMVEQTQKENVPQELTQEDIRQLESCVHMLGSERVKEGIGLMQSYVEAVQKGELTITLFHKRISYFVKLAVRNYEKVLKVQQSTVLELQDIYRYQSITEYRDMLTAWMLRFHDLISEEFDDYKNKQKVQQALAYIHENYDKDLNMAVVSNSISMNYSLFSTAFKQYTGTNFVAYLKELRITQAKRLLEETDMRVNEISQAVGYENEKHFTKTFKAVCGVSPTEYRKLKF